MSSAQTPTGYRPTQLTDTADLLAAGPLAEASGNSAVALIPIGNIPNDQIQALVKNLAVLSKDAS